MQSSMGPRPDVLLLSQSSSKSLTERPCFQNYTYRFGMPILRLKKSKVCLCGKVEGGGRVPGKDWASAQRTIGQSPCSLLLSLVNTLTTAALLKSFCGRDSGGCPRPAQKAPFLYPTQVFSRIVDFSLQLTSLSPALFCL